MGVRTGEGPDTGVPLSNTDQLMDSGTEVPPAAGGAAKASQAAEGGAPCKLDVAAVSARGSSRILNSCAVT